MNTVLVSLSGIPHYKFEVNRYRMVGNREPLILNSSYFYAISPSGAKNSIITILEIFFLSS
jgi:hypothetical protein